jgi:hypothetical protein
MKSSEKDLEKYKMKSLITTLMITIFCCSGYANSAAEIPPILNVSNQIEKSISVWVTNTAGKYGQRACIPAGTDFVFEKLAGKSFVRVEVKVMENADCTGNVIESISSYSGTGWTAIATKDSYGHYVIETKSEDGPSNPQQTVGLDNRIGDGHSVWIIAMDAQGMVTDMGCVRPGTVKLFSAYYPSPHYQFRTQVMENEDCTGTTLTDFGEVVNAESRATLIGDSRGYYFVD